MQSSDNFLEWLDQALNPNLPYRSIKKNYNYFRNVKPKICAECKGACCKRCGCHFSPDDFKEISFEYLRDQIQEKGYISIDYVDGEMILQNFGVYILRVRNQGAPIVDLGYQRSPCSLLTENGCTLSYHDRPTGGKLLIPTQKFGIGIISSSERQCYSSYTIENCCYEWKPHQKIIRRLIEYFKESE